MRIGINAMLRWGYTGVGNYISNLISALGEVDQDNDYYIFIHSASREYISVGQKNFCFVECRINIDNPIYSRLWEQIHLPRMAKYYDLDVMHCPINVVPIFLSCPTVLTILDTLHFQYPESISFWRRTYNRLFIRTSFMRADAIITISEVVREEIDRLLGDSKDIRVTHLGVDPSFRVIENPAAIEEIRRHYKIPYKYVLFIGYPHSRKNIPRLVSAFGRIMSRLSEPYMLVIAGDTSRRVESDVENIHRMVDKMELWDRIVFTGQVPQEMMPALINGAELLAFPSIYEGFGLPALEAMACGIPVFASNIPTFQEVVGGAGLLVNPYSIEEIADGLYQALADRNLREQMVRLGLERAQKFGWRETARLTLECYKDVSQARH
jgi:glycosyltransferase involved in cell wall biosynthesis